MSIEVMMKSCDIFSKYINSDELIFHAEHDTLIGPHIDLIQNLSNNDKEDLEELGWSITDYECWSRNCSC